EVLSRLDGTSGTPGCWQVAEDERRQIWVQRSRGYSVYRPEQDTFFHLFPFGKQEKARVDYFAADKAGRMWVAGTGMGLCLADPSAPELGFRKRLKLGLKNPQCLLVDAKNRIWMGSEEGLAYLSADLNRAVYYPLAYGLDEPVETLALLSSGEIAVGQRGAVHIFHPDRLMHNLEKPRPYLTAFKVFQQEYKTDTLLSHLRVIRLRHDQNYFSFEFSAIGYNLPEEQKFEYRLQGVDPDWINPGKRRYAAYTNLASGDYVFLLRVANNEGLWCEQPYRLAIHISTPWWNTWWARLSLLALLVASLYGLYRFQLRRRLEHAEALRLKELDTVKSRLYTNITHEFRTPLTVINGMAEHIKADPQQWLSEGPDLILRNSQNLLTLVNQMLELRKLEAGMLPAHLVLSDIVAYVRYLTESFHSYAEFKKIDLNVVSQWAHFEMDYDPDKILTIVTNLLSNAIKFTPAGGSITLHIGAPSEQTGGPEHIEISVRDTGIGIPPEELPLIFNRFYQAGASSEGGGTGIGLALSKELAQLLGGNIRVTSSYGQGTVFTVTLPVSRQATSAPAWPDIQGKIRLFPTPVEANQPAPDTRPDHRPLVHIVEDNPDVVRYLRACLEPEYRVAVAADGKAGLEQATAEVPDLVISDVMMPEMDGLEMCLQLKTDVRTSHIPVILLTARADLDSRLQGLRHGADIYLAKPFDKTELALQIRNLLNGRKALQAHYLALATQQQPLPHAGPAPEENAFVLNMRAIVEAHLGDPAFAVERFCREAGMSNSNLHRKLTALTGRSANQFIRYIRLAKACTLLCDPERTIAAVADDCGFNDPVYFARAFKQEFGVSPSEYRHTKGR
ncbi:MAG: response regulator, partial [Saprospiraceae bacterium]|nr:response regulator [Saprospiraceae bacterium]